MNVELIISRIRSLGIIPEEEHLEIAELIIKECVNVADAYVRDGHDSSTARSLIGVEIKKHFGVE